MLSRYNFNEIDVLEFGTISFGNIATMQTNKNNDKFYFLQLTLTEIIMSIFITKNNTYLLQNNSNQSL